ncbi:unnamed protein product [Caenorhabditis nigoni]
MATNEEGTIGKETASELMLAALEQLKVEVAGGIQNDNKQNFAEITDRLTLIEASVSEISKLIGNVDSGPEVSRDRSDVLTRETCLPEKTPENPPNV